MYDCVPSLKEFIDNLLKNDNVLQLWVGKNQPISLYSKTTKHEDIFYKENARKKCKTNKTISCFYKLCKHLQSWCFEFYQSWTTDKNTESAIIIKLKDSLNEFRGFKFVTTMTLEFERTEKMIKQNKALFNSNSKAEKTINKSEIHLFESICSAIISNTQKYLGCR